MTQLVADASIIGRMILPDERSDLLKNHADMVMAADLIQPAHWPVEVCGLVLKASRRNRIDTGELDRLLASAINLVALANVETFSPMSSIIDIAIRHHLTVYDAAYLELASRKNLPLLTADKALRAAAAKANVELGGSVLP